jgi:hypothetical protein
MTKRKDSQRPKNDDSLGDAPSQPARNRAPSERGVGREYSREQGDAETSPTSKAPI